MEKFRKSAQSLIEYGLILALVAVIAITVLTKFGGSITNVGNQASNTVNTTGNNATNNYCTSIGKTKYNSSTGQCE